MAATLQGATGLIYLPGRTSTRLENGVVEVSRTYACRTADAASLRDLFDVGQKMPGEPSVTIKFNFTETTREDGFTEFSVTGSGPDPSQPSSGQSGIKIQETRSVTNFPSGLVRVERTYVCPTAEVGKFSGLFNQLGTLPLDDGTPAIDGLYIYPQPNQNTRSDGFTEFQVTAYGRTSIFSNISLERSTIKGSYSYQSGGTSSEIPAIVEIYILRGVISTSESAASILQAPKIDNPIILPAPDYSTPLNLKSGNGQIITSGVYLSNYSSTNFGYWTEYVATWQAFANVTQLS